MLTGDSFFHLAGYGEALPGLNLCGAGRVVCLIDPVGDVYACPFAIHDNFLAGNVRCAGGFRRASGGSPSCSPTCAGRRPAAPASPARRYDSCRGGCMAAKFFTGLPLDGPDPECVKGHGEPRRLTGGGQRTRRTAPVRRPLAPLPSRRPVPVTDRRPAPGRFGAGPPDRACDENPLAGFRPLT